MICTDGDEKCKYCVQKMSDDVLLGLKELNAKLLKMDAKLAKKTLKSAMMYATGPTVKEIKLAAPRGKEAHRTHKGRLVAPGFLSRSIVRRGALGKNGYELKIGAKGEAFYGVSFLDEGITVTSRNGKKIKPYTIKADNWFKSRFEKDQHKIVARFRSKLQQRVEEATR